MDWAAAPQNRDQMVLFSHRLDDVLATDHTVRLFNDILGRMEKHRDKKRSLFRKLKVSSFEPR